MSSLRVSDVTAIFNTHAFWAYLLSTALIPPQDGTPRWQPHKLVAVLLACVGVFATVYGSADVNQPAGVAGATTTSSTALLGNVLTLISAISYALYQVAYKKYAVPDINRGEYEPLRAEDGELGTRSRDQDDQLPFGLFANFVTSTVGLTTLGALWIPVAIMHWAGESKFELPADGWTAMCVCAIAVSGLMFNAGFMVSQAWVSCELWLMFACYADSVVVVGSDCCERWEPVNNCFGYGCRW
jgi:drug/metabolite transporter (DMT)-like permease